MHPARRLLFCAFALLLVCQLFSSTARAASVHVTPIISAVVRDDFATPADWVPDGAGGALIDPGQGTTFSIIDFTVEIRDLAGPPDEVGFGNVVFDIELTGGVSDLLGWINGPNVDIDSFHCFPQPFPGLCIPKFADNADMGRPGDLIDIVVGVAPRAFRPEGEDPRRTIGQNGPETMGFIAAAIDTDSRGNRGQVEAVVKAFSTWDEDLLLARNDGPRFGGTVNLNVVPEPTASVLLILGCSCLVAVRRRSCWSSRPQRLAPMSCRVRVRQPIPTLLILLLFSPSATAGAATIHVTHIVSNVVRDDFVTPAAWTRDGTGSALIEPGQGTTVSQIDFLVEIRDLAGPPDEIGFGNVVFDILLNGGVYEPGIGWIADNNCRTHVCPTWPFCPCVPKWSDNADMGNSGDLVDIVVGFAPRNFGPEGVDPRRGLGQNGPAFMGSVFVAVDTNTARNRGQVDVIVKAFSTWDEDLLLTRNDGPRFGGTVSLRVVPEPAAVVLLALGCICAAVFRLSRPAA